MKVDIIVATYKRYDLLQEALKSVANQKLSALEMLDCRRMASRKKLMKAVKPFLRDNRFAYLPGTHAAIPCSPKSRHSTRNCSYIASLDDDDLWLPQKLENQIAFMESHSDCVLLGCNGFLWKGTREAELMHNYILKRKKMFGKINYDNFINQNYLITFLL